MRRPHAVAALAVALASGCGSDSASNGGSGTASAVSAPEESADDGGSGRGRESWEGETLDGEPVVIVEGEGGPSFVDGRPSPLVLIDQAGAAGGCDALQLELNYWEAQAGPTDDGRRASAFAKYAQDQRAELGC